MRALIDVRLEPDADIGESEMLSKNGSQRPVLAYYSVINVI